MHPIVAQLKPSEEQKPAIRDRGRDVVVTAGAGTGKTRTLVARYLSLLAEGSPLRSVVAITFTRKAAREMRNRIRAEMGRYLERADLSEQERGRWSDLYNELDAARIGTIHNFCIEILRAHPAEGDVDPRFNVLSEGQAGILLAQAIDEALSWAADDPAAVSLFGLFGARTLRSTLERLLAQRLETLAVFDGLPVPLWPAWQARLAQSIRGFVDHAKVQRGFVELQALRDDGALDRAEAQEDALAPLMRLLLELWDGILSARAAEDWAGIAKRLPSLRANMKQKGSKRAWAPADPKAVIKELQTSYDEGLGLWLKDGVNPDLDQALAEAMPELRRLFDQAGRAYRRLKRQGRDLDFDDLEHKALQLLQEHPAVRARWQREVSAILVDEFQDTNDRQRKIVNLVNEDSGKLFIVGDAKQSIYRFRGADVAVFRQERARIETSGAAYELATSYRAHRELIQGLNALLRPVLGETEDPVRPWREPFAPIKHHRQKPKAGLGSPYVELHLTVGSKGDGALDRAATALTGRLRELVDGDETELTYENFAILCRASTSFGAYEDALDEAGIPYLTVAGRGFYDRPEIRDLLNVLKALADPTDNLALVGLLRSPVFGFSDLELYALCRPWVDGGKTHPLWHTLQQLDGQKAERAVKIIDDLHQQAGRTPVAGLLKAFLKVTDYRAALLRVGKSRSARNVSKLLADAHDSSIVGVGAFLDYVAGLRAGAAREGEARATADGAVSIMSIHAAKGLEFPVVVIGDINYDRPARSGLLLEPGVGILPRLADEEGALPGLYRLLGALEVDREAAESERLLYVAATRAKDKLILSGCIRLTGRGSPSNLRGWLKMLAEPLSLREQPIGYDEAGSRAPTLALPLGETMAGLTVYEPGYEAGQAAGEEMVIAKPVGTWSSRLIEKVIPGDQQLDERTRAREQEPRPRVWRAVPRAQRPRAPAWVVGALIHEALAAWRFPEASFRAWAEARGRAYGLVDRQRLADAARQTARLLVRFRAHSLFTEMTAAERLLHEVPYSYRIEDTGQVEMGLLDALYRHDGIWTLVEFKTDRVRDESEINSLLAKEDYVQQVRRYAAAVEQLVGPRPRAILCFLNGRDGIYLRSGV